MVKRQFLKNKCCVLFELPESLAHGAKRVYLVGNFNSWDAQATPMKQDSSGKFTVSLDLNLNQEYEYLYVIDGELWYRDPEAETNQPSLFSSGVHSVVNTYPTASVTTL